MYVICLKCKAELEARYTCPAISTCGYCTPPKQNNAKEPLWRKHVSRKTREVSIEQPDRGRG